MADTGPAGDPPPPTPNRRPEKIKVKLADGKVRTIAAASSATTFWSADGTPMSAAQFLEALYGDAARVLQGRRRTAPYLERCPTPARSYSCMDLAEKDFGREQLAEMQKIIEAENSDLFDVLAYVAFAAEPVTRAARADAAKAASAAELTDRHRAFIEFILAQYVAQGVDELDDEKLNLFLRMRYGRSLQDGLADLGGADRVRALFLGVQRRLYERAGAVGVQ